MRFASATTSNRLSLPRALGPLQGSGVGGLAWGQFLRRKIVDRDGSGDGVGGGAKVLRLGVGNHALRARRIDVADTRVAQAVAQGLRVDREREGALEPREPL